VSDELAPALETLRETSRALSRAVDGDDPAAVEEALRQRSAAFDRVVELAPPAPADLPPGPRAVLAAVLNTDADTIARAQARGDGIGQELAELRRAREVVRRHKDGKDPARFVSERV
jgi:hypothetical protein